MQTSQTFLGISKNYSRPRKPKYNSDLPCCPQRTPESASHPAPLQSACWSFFAPSPGAQKLPPEMSLSTFSELLLESCSHLPLLCLNHPHPRLLVFIVKIVLACLQPQALWFSSLLLRIHTANTWSELTSYLKERKKDCKLLFICCTGLPHAFEITTVPEICGVDWRGAAEGTRQSLKTVSKL